MRWPRPCCAPEALPGLAADGTTAVGLATLLGDNPSGAFLLVKGALAQAASPDATSAGPLTSAAPARLVVVADQLEELFTLGYVTPSLRGSFVVALASLARSGQAWIIATLRSDFYARVAELPELVALKGGTGQYDLLPPSSGEVAQIVRGPARAAGLQFEVEPLTGEPLDDVLRDAAAGSPENLPLLEFALEELYKCRTPEGVLTHAAYRALGGVAGALAQCRKKRSSACPRRRKRP